MTRPPAAVAYNDEKCDEGNDSGRASGGKRKVSVWRRLRGVRMGRAKPEREEGSVEEIDMPRNTPS